MTTAAIMPAETRGEDDAGGIFESGGRALADAIGTIFLL